jgi:HAD superfamily hydrolase (TIGR01509 family)
VTPTRIPCRAIFLDAGGVIVLPDRHLLADALARVDITIDPDSVPRAHYRAVRVLDRATAPPTAAPAPPTPAPTQPTPAPARPTAPPPPSRTDYPQALFPQLGIVPGRTAEALAIWGRLADRRRSGEILWSEPTPGARRTIDALRRAGVAVAVLTNSDGHAAENLAACGFAGIPVIDSEIVGSRKPEPSIFHAALSLLGTDPRATAHVGDTLANDVAGAGSAGITPIHFDPLRACRAPDHRHICTLPGIWHHVRPVGDAPVPRRHQTKGASSTIEVDNPPTPRS